jgi:hypothetical protein
MSLSLKRTGSPPADIEHAFAHSSRVIWLHYKGPYYELALTALAASYQNVKHLVLQHNVRLCQGLGYFRQFEHTVCEHFTQLEALEAWGGGGRDVQASQASVVCDGEGRPGLEWIIQDGRMV